MIPVRNISELPKNDPPIILAMGCFDGVHLGHQKVITTAVEQATQLDGEAWVFTFKPHPAKILVPKKAPALISTEPSQLQNLKALGVHGVLEIPFDKTYAHTDPTAFLSNLWKKIPTLTGIVCGIDWSFGYRAAGTFQTLENLCAAHGITATAVTPLLHNGEKISSTNIRQAITEGNLPLAAKWLGRPFTITGRVIKGKQIGRTLGFPTANIDSENELLPAPGIYAGWTRIQTAEKKEQASAIFIGVRETFGDKEHTIESHLLDYDGDLYGQTLEISLLQKIREVIPFPTREALIEQIEKDIEQIRYRISNHWNSGI